MRDFDVDDWATLMIADPPKWRALFSKEGLLTDGDNSMYISNRAMDFGGTLGVVGIGVGETEIEATIEARRAYYNAVLPKEAK